MIKKEEGNINVSDQIIQYFKILREIDEKYSDLKTELYDKNFDNIFERIKPNKEINENIGINKITILIHDLNNLKIV